MAQADEHAQFARWAAKKCDSAKARHRVGQGNDFYIRVAQYKLEAETAANFYAVARLAMGIE